MRLVVLLGILATAALCQDPRGAIVGTVTDPTGLAPLVELVRESSVLAPHFHLPLQHASDRILRAMRRPYTLDYYARLVDTIRVRIRHASIGADVIVGFPGEREEDFDCLHSYLETSPLTHVHADEDCE